MMRSTSVVGIDGGLNEVESAVFCEQVLSQFDPNDRAVIERVMDYGVTRDIANGIRQARRRMYGSYAGMEWNLPSMSNYGAHRFAYKMGFIR